MKNTLLLLLIVFFAACQSETAVAPSEKLEFTSSPESLHYYLLSFPGLMDAEQLTELKQSLKEYNETNFPVAKLRISNIYLGDGTTKTPMIVIRRFLNEGEAMVYHQKFMSDKVLDADSSWGMVGFPASQANYRTILKKKDIQEYKSFFEEKIKK